MSSTEPAHILVVDDEAPQMRAIRDTLGPRGYRVTGVTSGPDALSVLRREEVDLLLTDLMMPDMDGIELLRRSLELDPDLVCVMMTGQGTISTAVEAMKAGSLDYVLKPFKLDAILTVVSRALAVRRLRRENLQLREALSIHELASGMTFSLDAGSVLRTLVEAAHRLSDGGGACVLLPDGRGEVLHVAERRGEETAGAGRSVPMTGDILAWVAGARARSASDDPTGVLDPPLPGALGRVAIPMLAGGKLVGVVSLQPGAPLRDRIPASRLRGLGILASIGAAALEAAGLMTRLSAAETRYRRLAENAPDVIYRLELTPRRRFAYVSPAATTVFGRDPEEFYADPDLGLAILHPEDGSRWTGLAGIGSDPGTTSVVRARRKDGEAIFIEQRHVVLEDEGGDPVAVEGIIRDVTDRQRAEEAIRGLNRELEARVQELHRSNEGLERSNIELRQFAHVASHDLQTPLRSIAGFVELLRARYRDQLDRSAVSYIDRAVSGTRHMQSLLQALAEHVGVEARARPFTAVGLDVVYDDVIALLDSSIRDSGGTVTRDELPEVWGDRSQLVQLLQNLIGNALIYHGDEPPRVHVSARRDGRSWVVSVRDEGIGIAPEHHERIFDLFDRLHTSQEYPGTGIGLAICRRIVRRHAGRIQVDSEEGRGSTFRITLPAASATATTVGDDRGAGLRPAARSSPEAPDAPRTPPSTGRRPDAGGPPRCRCRTAGARFAGRR